MDEHRARVALHSLCVSLTKVLKRKSVRSRATWNRVSRTYLLATLEASGDSVPTTARLLGLHRRTVERQLNEVANRRKRQRRSGAGGADVERRGRARRRA